MDQEQVGFDLVGEIISAILDDDRPAAHRERAAKPRKGRPERLGNICDNLHERELATHRSKGELSDLWVIGDKIGVLRRPFVNPVNITEYVVVCSPSQFTFPALQPNCSGSTPSQQPL